MLKTQSLIKTQSSYALVSPVRLMLVLFFICALLIAAGGLAHAANPTQATTVTTPEPVADVVTSPEDPNSITLDFKDADINTVLRVLSLKSHVNIVAGPDVKGTVTIRLEDVPWEKALEVVLRTYEYVYEREGNVIRVTTRDKVAQEPVVTQTFVLNYTKASEIELAVKDILTERGRIKTAERTNTVIITDIPTNLFRISEVVKKLDRITPQAFIDSKIVKTDVGEAENLGIEWGTGDAGNIASLTGAGRPTTFPFITNTKTNQESIDPLFKQFLPIISQATSLTDAGKQVANPADLRGFVEPPPGASGNLFTFGTLDMTKFTTVLQMLRSHSNTKVVSNPRILVLNNQTAKVQVGSQIPLPTFERNKDTGSVEITGFSFRDVGVVLNVTPHINSQEEILVELKPEVSALGAQITFGADFSAPSFDITQASTQVLIRSGQTIAIGGLMTDAETTTESKVPYLSDIPLVGKIFRSKRQAAGAGNKKVETLFFVTVTTVDMDGQPVLGTGKSNKGRKGTSTQIVQALRDEEKAGGVDPAKSGVTQQAETVPNATTKSVPATTLATA